MNSFIKRVEEMNNIKHTENGAAAYKSTASAVYDMFALGGAYRGRPDEDILLLFMKALAEDETLALKCLFYLRDCRGGQGERRFFRVAYKWLIKEHPNIAIRNLEHISEYGRWDDLIYVAFETSFEKRVLEMIKKQLVADLTSEAPSLLGKWIPSEGASSATTKKYANIIRKYLGLTHKQYRKMLSQLREKIKVVERLMSANRWDEIDFDKIPSKAGLLYRDAFARRDLIAEKYKEFAESKDTKVNADTLYPYEIVEKSLKHIYSISETERNMLNKYWENLPDYLGGNPSDIMCVVDTSGSMFWGGNTHMSPLSVAISLGLYCAERVKGSLKDYYISFSRYPEFVKIEGIDFVDKVRRIQERMLNENTNLSAVFELLKIFALDPKVNKEDLPKTIVVISDMEIDGGGYPWNRDNTATKMKAIRRDWEAEGLTLPRLVYWNVSARSDTILDSGDNVSFVSGCSPVLFEQVIRGVSGYDLMLDKLSSVRYENIK